MTKSIVLGGGCFWCVEAIFQRVKGVSKVESGYAGGEVENPNYNNHSGHAEVIRVSYDESIITLETILDVFFHVHDPTTLNQQGYDMGEEYRSIVLYEDSNEGETVVAAKELAAADWKDPIVTEIKKLDKFYNAEDFHDNFYNRNTGAIPYCQVVIDPKLEKFRKRYANLVKEEQVS